MPEGGQLGVILALHAAFRRRDLDALADLIDPEVDWHASNALPFGGPLHGTDAVRGYLTDLWAFFDNVDLGTPELHHAGASVMATGVQTVSTQNGETHELQYSQLFTLENALVVRYRERNDAGEVVRAVTDEMAVEAQAD